MLSSSSCTISIYLDELARVMHVQVTSAGTTVVLQLPTYDKITWYPRSVSSFEIEDGPQRPTLHADKSPAAMRPVTFANPASSVLLLPCLAPASFSLSRRRSLRYCAARSWRGVESASGVTSCGGGRKLRHTEMGKEGKVGKSRPQCQLLVPFS